MARDVLRLSHGLRGRRILKSEFRAAPFYEPLRYAVRLRCCLIVSAVRFCLLINLPGGPDDSANAALAKRAEGTCANARRCEQRGRRLNENELGRRIRSIIFHRD